MATPEYWRSGCGVIVLVILACCCQPAAAHADEHDAAIAADIEMAKIISAAARAAIEEVWRNTHAFPADRHATGMSPTPADTRSGPVAALDVRDGHVFVTFSEEAHPSLVGKTVVFSPKATTEQTIEWRRNRAPEALEQPDGARSAAWSYYID